MVTRTAYNFLKTVQIDTSRIPKYKFNEATLTDANVLNLIAYNTIIYTSNGSAFSIDIDDNADNTVRDCILVIDVPENIQVPTITWSNKFYPRADAETDLICTQGKNVYWVSEYIPNKFVVAHWSEISGGDAA